MNPRIIPFERIVNARDLGGIPTMDGRTVRCGLLIRSANLSQASQADIRRLQETYRLAAVVDLRTAPMRVDVPDMPVPGAEYIPISVLAEKTVGITKEKSVTPDAVLKAAPDMPAIYRRIITDETSRSNLGQAARCVMETVLSEGAVLWHCSEGKDRAGLLAAVLLAALDVKREAIMEDYLLTNLVNGVKAEKYYQNVLASGCTEAEAMSVRDCMLAKEEYLAAAFAAADELYKNTESFLCDGLKIPSALIENFKDRVIEDRKGAECDRV